MGEQDSCRQPAPRRRVCVACDNRHGCRSPQPPCLRLERSPAERRLGGRALLARRGRLAACRGCALFRRCWDPDSYRRCLAAGGS